MANARKAFTTPNEVAGFCNACPGEGRAKSRHAIHSKHGSGLFIEVRRGRAGGLWMYRFHQAGKQREMMLGGYPAMTLKAAREAHSEAVALVKRGIDPRRHRAAEKAVNASAWTMGEAFNKWIEYYAVTPIGKRPPPTTKTVEKQRGRWRLYLDGDLGNCYVRDVSRRQLIAVLEGVASEAREEARQCLSMVRKVLEYCVDREQIEDNPASSLTPAKIKTGPATPRDRHLKLTELRALWDAVSDEANSRLSLPVANAIKLLIMTGARRSEVVGMRWDEIKGDTWTLPASRTKSRRKHDVHLCSLTHDILNQQRELSDGDFVFSALNNAERPLHPDSISTAVARLQGRSRKKHDEDAPLYELLPFTAHDLRRTVATLWTETLLADPLLVDSMLAHSPPTLLGTYNKSKRYEAQADIWSRWGQMVSEMIVSDPGANVVSLRGGVA